jgi:hypothetical protein
MDLSLSIGCPGHRQALPLHACVEYPQDKVKGAMIAEFALRSAPGRREVREDKCDELRLGELNGNRRRSWAFRHIAHRKWVDVKPERSSPESLTIAYNTKGYGTRKTRNHLTRLPAFCPDFEGSVANLRLRQPRCMIGDNWYGRAAGDD